MASSFQNQRPIILCILLLVCSSSSRSFIRAASFNESCSAADPPCSALVAYRIASAPTAIANISSIFSVTPQDIVSANGFPPGADVYAPLANETLKIMLPCPCRGGQRAGNLTYTVVAGDWLSKIAEKYGGLVTFQEIANASGISNPDEIVVGQNVTIPYPCSCRDGTLVNQNAIFMSYVVQEGESVGMFAREYGLTATQLMALNPGLEFEQGNVIRLPIASCKANFSRDATDANLTVPAGSYVTTANGCVQCSCTGAELYCAKAPLAPSNCRVRCRNSELEVGDHSTSLQQSGCKVESCSYDGYSRSNGIFTKIQSYVTNVTCQNVAEGPSGFAYAPEGQGVPEAFGGPSITPAAGGPPLNTNTPVTTAPPPESASTITSLNGVQSMVMMFLVLLIVG